jgi:hypothetical protein
MNAKDIIYMDKNIIVFEREIKHESAEKSRYVRPSLYPIHVIQQGVWKGEYTIGKSRVTEDCKQTLTIGPKIEYQDPEPMETLVKYKYNITTGGDYFPRMKFDGFMEDIQNRCVGVQLTVNDMPIGWLSAPRSQEYFRFFTKFDDTYDKEFIPMRDIMYQLIHVVLYFKSEVQIPPTLIVQGSVSPKYKYIGKTNIKIKYPGLNEPYELMYEAGTILVNPFMPYKRIIEGEIPKKISITDYFQEFMLHPEELIKKYVINQV